MQSRPSAVIVGGGVIGGGIALELLERGFRVTVIDKGAFGSEASSAAAGLLGIHADLFDNALPSGLLHESQRIHRPWTEKLEFLSNSSVQYRRAGILRVAMSDEQAEDYQERAREVTDICEWLPRVEVLRREPHVGRDIVGGVLFPNDALLVPPAVIHALQLSISHLGCTIREKEPAIGLLTRGSHVIGVRTTETELYADVVIVAAGAWSTSLLKPIGVYLPVYPIQGQAYLVRTQSPPSCVIQDASVYVIPRSDGTTLIGATYVEGSYDKSPTVSALRDLHGRAEKLLPHLKDAELLSTWVGLRPGTPDGLPYIGKLSPFDGLYVATGHGGNGMILAPITAKTLSALLHGETVSDETRLFDPARVPQSGA